MEQICQGSHSSTEKATYTYLQQRIKSERIQINDSLHETSEEKPTKYRKQKIWYMV